MRSFTVITKQFKLRNDLEECIFDLLTTHENIILETLTEEDNFRAYVLDEIKKINAYYHHLKPIHAFWSRMSAAHHPERSGDLWMLTLSGGSICWFSIFLENKIQYNGNEKFITWSSLDQ